MSTYTMWGYWRDKYGSPVVALESQYAATLENDLRLQQAVAMVKNGELLIDTLMQEKAAEEPDDDE